MAGIIYTERTAEQRALNVAVAPTSHPVVQSHYREDRIHAELGRRPLTIQHQRSQQLAVQLQENPQRQQQVSQHQVLHRKWHRL